MRPDWNEYFMAVAKIISTRSTCNSRPTGAVIVKDKHILATGYNGSVPGALQCTDENNENNKGFCFRRSIGAPESDKYNFCRASHAEANAIAQAARFGVPLEGAVLYVTLVPCYNCLKLLATARVRHIFYEYEYESSNRERDNFWNRAVKDTGIETFQQLHISEETIKIFNMALEYPTSKRRLKEGIVDSVQGIRDLYTLIETRIYKEALFSTVMSKPIEGKLFGTVLEITIEPMIERRLDQSRYLEGLNILNSMLILNGNILSASELLQELISKTVISHSGRVSVPGGSNEITTVVNGNRLNLVLTIEEADLLGHFPAILDAVCMIYEDVYMNLLEHYDLSLQRGKAKLIIRHPYIQSTSTERARAVIMS